MSIASKLESSLKTQATQTDPLDKTQSDESKFDANYTTKKGKVPPPPPLLLESLKLQPQKNEKSETRSTTFLDDIRNVKLIKPVETQREKKKIIGLLNLTKINIDTI